VEERIMEVVKQRTAAVAGGGGEAGGSGAGGAGDDSDTDSLPAQYRSGGNAQRTNVRMQVSFAALRAHSM
jgi:hypothetical protein